MDNNKDTQKTEKITQFVDKQTIKTYPFGDNKMGERAYRRAERLVAAVHLLTNHVPATEPIRRIARESSVSLLGDILELRDEMRTVGSKKTYEIEGTIRHLISLVRILAISGFVSFENADVLTDALDDLGAFMQTSRRSVLSESIRLSREDLIDVRNIVKESIKDINSNIDKDKVPEAVLYQKDTSDRGSMRVAGIIEVLKTGREMGIKDIAVNLPEYSEKMIQRELAELVNKGSVKKVGLKRWSRYVLANVNAIDGASAEAPYKGEVKGV